ncbi:NAD(P)/FAD-dependent oxidoreductase [Arcicella sp. LKC2W]|uniref:flavin monoamine oxidase family protein n=1 Tax=Arcicella sp. LKC2W TaxID=2984198 RepID=UPI002B2069B4|nr:NAD(P)/FAD-dependent oxidoreductase [Arcicella sp. LKC2W]MEA5458193.1 NAD(P)/FAD-dependent oxidoreductase [Arcicella sp. LKC2W]
MKSPILRLFRKAFLEAQPEEFTIDNSRRNFIKTASIVSASAFITTNLTSCVTRKGIKIAIIGGGIAGLNAAHHLKKAGFTPTIYEAAKRTGGRIMSATGLLADGITTELGGEFIDSSHKDMLDLCKEFNLGLLDMQAPEEVKKGLIQHDYYFDNHRINDKSLIEAIKPYVAIIKKDADLVATNNFKNPALVALDKLSLDEYLQKIGISGWLYNLLRISYTSEMGLESDIQSCLAFLTLLNTNSSTSFDIYGTSDERYKVIGGNQKVVDALAKTLEENIETGYQLEALTEKGMEYELVFQNGKQIFADFVIMTIPFSVLREVKMNVDMSPKKEKCIKELSYGTNSKMFLGMKNRLWREQGFSGYVLSNLIHNGWDSSQMQNQNTGAGGYSIFTGGKMGKELNNNSVDGFVNHLNTIYPNFKEQFNGKKGVFNWGNAPLAKGSYACMTVGQQTALGGVEGEPINSILFAGEHCSKTSQGYMNGGAETGRMAAEELIKRVGSKG